MPDKETLNKLSLLSSQPVRMQKKSCTMVCCEHTVVPYVQHVRVFIDSFQNVRNGKSNSGTGVINVPLLQLHFND